MEKRRTVLVKLEVDSADATLLEDTVDEFLWAANYVTRHAFEGEYVTTSKTTLHDDTYEDVRDETALHSNHVQAARNKAAEYGIDVEQVYPENTSRRCSHCGFTHPENRDSENFECLECGYENHADYNAAKNIGLWYLHCNQTGDGGGAPVGVRLNSGTLNANGEYEPPAEKSARAGVHAESPPL